MKLRALVFSLAVALASAGCSGSSSSSSSSTSSTGTTTTGTTASSGSTGASTTTTTGSASGSSGSPTTASSSTSGSSGASSTGGSTSGSTGTSYCDGFAADNAAGDAVLVQTYAFHHALRRCINQIADGGTLPQLGGVWDLDINDNSPYATALFPAACEDLGLTPTTRDGGFGNGFDGGPGVDGGTTSDDGGAAIDAGPPTIPSGALTVAQAVTGQGSAVTFYGVVTAVSAWAINPDGGKGTSGQLYVQDAVADGGVPAPNSGISAYFDDVDLAGVQDNVPSRGDLIALTNMNWSPYHGQNQFAATPATTIVDVGQVGVPPAVVLTATDLSSDGGSAASQPYRGMRVITSDGPYTTESTCPAGVTYTPSGG